MEGIVNALIHRSYTELGSEVHIDMFDDRLEIYSPGGMVGGVSIKDVDILNVPSKRRNPIFADIFGRLKYMERRGSGFKKIINAYETQQNYKESLKPIFNSFNNDFILTLFNLNYNANVPQDVTDNVGVNVGVNDGVNDGVKMTKSELDVYSEIIKNNNLTAEEISKILNKTKRTIERIIYSLKEKNIIKRVGSDKTGHWEIIS